ncbi:MAG: hypothetical protein ACR2M5_16960 [Nakamurella sp.]
MSQSGVVDAPLGADLGSPNRMTGKVPDVVTEERVVIEVDGDQDEQA